MELKKIRHIAKTKKRKKKILENLQRYATSHAEHTVKAPKSCRRLLKCACVVPALFGSTPTTERLPQILHFAYKLLFLTSGGKCSSKASPMCLVKWPGGSWWSLCPAHPGPEAPGVGTRAVGLMQGGLRGTGTSQKPLPTDMEAAGEYLGSHKSLPHRGAGLWHTEKLPLSSMGPLVVTSGSLKLCRTKVNINHRNVPHSLAFPEPDLVSLPCGYRRNKKIKKISIGNWLSLSPLPLPFWHKGARCSTEIKEQIIG